MLSSDCVFEQDFQLNGLGALGRIQDFLIWGSKLQRGLDLLIVPNFLLFFPDFLKILHENGIILSRRGVFSEPPLDPPLEHVLNPHHMTSAQHFVCQYLFPQLFPCWQQILQTVWPRSE